MQSFTNYSRKEKIKFAAIPCPNLTELALEYPGDTGDQDKFAVELVAWLDDQIGSVDGEVSKDERSTKNNSKKIGTQIIMSDNSRIKYTGIANDIIYKEDDLIPQPVSAARNQKDFAFRHKDMEKYIYVNTRPDGKRGGGAKADPNELMTATLCTLASVPTVESIEDLDALLEQVKKIVPKKVEGYTELEVEALEKDYGNLCQAISAAQVIIDNGGGSADKVYITAKSWHDDVKDFKITKYGMADFNASDFIIKKGDTYIGISLKKKKSAKTADPTIINNSLAALMKSHKVFDKVRSELDVAHGEFYIKIVRLANKFQRNPRFKDKAVDKDGNPWLNQRMLDTLGKDGKGITSKNWKDFVQNIPNEFINRQLKGTNSLFKIFGKAITNESDLFANVLMQLILKTDLKTLQKVNFDYALVTGVGRYLVKGPVIESGEYHPIGIMATKVDDLLKTGKPAMVLDERNTQAFDRGATAAMLYFRLTIGKVPIADITLRYKGNFQGAPSFQASLSSEFKEALHS
jgi:hypothetical protein